LSTVYKWLLNNMLVACLHD